jgi:hypothetical protein
MIKIIKPGKTDFRMTCNKCGCIFEYNVEDIQDSYIKCPTCHKEYYGFEPECLEKPLFDTGLAECEPADYLGKAGRLQTLPNEPTYQSLNECEGCPTYKQLCSPTGYVGDLSCQWCNKNPWKVTCDTATYTTSAGNATRGSRSWTTCSATAFTDEDRKITCKAEGVEYTTTLEGYPETSYDIYLDTADCTYTNVEPSTSYYTVELNANGGSGCSCTPCKCEELTTSCSCRADEYCECQAASANKLEEINK